MLPLKIVYIKTNLWILWRHVAYKYVVLKLLHFKQKLNLCAKYYYSFVCSGFQ